VRQSKYDNGKDNYVEFEDSDSDAACCTGTCKSNEMTAADVTSEQ